LHERETNSTVALSASPAERQRRRTAHRPCRARLGQISWNNNEEESNMKKTIFAVTAVALAAAAANAQLTNGGFETGDFTGWSQFGDLSFTGVTSGTLNGVGPQEGAFHAYFGPIGSGGISQAIAANTGDTLTITFMLGNNPYNSPFPDDSVSVDVGGVNLAAATNVGSLNYGGLSFTLTSPVDNPVLSFTFHNAPDYWLLDNVAVNVTQTPAPGAAAVLGLGGLAAGRRRRR
jgi:MYXO-CTERM domain-containing protein